MINIGTFSIYIFTNYLNALQMQNLTYFHVIFPVIDI